MNSPATNPDPMRVFSTSLTDRACPESNAAVAQLTDESALARLMKEAADAHHKFEEATGKPDADWPTWYAKFILGQLYPSTRKFEPLPQLAVGYPRTSEQAERELDAAARAPIGVFAAA